MGAEQLFGGPVTRMIDMVSVVELVNKSLKKKDPSYLLRFISTNNFKTREITKIVEVILKNFSEEQICELSNLLLRDGSDISKDLVCDLMWVCYPNHREYVLDALINLSDDEDWGIRESAAWLVYHLLKNYYSAFKPFLREMIRSKSPNVRRTAAVGIMRFAKHRIPSKGRELLRVIEPLLYDKDNYVKRNLGPFVVGDGFIRYYTKETISWLKKWMEDDDEQVRWNIAKVFTTAESANHFGTAVEILGHLAEDKRGYVRGAVLSALRNLMKRKANELLKVLSKWEKDVNKREVVEEMFEYYKKLRKRSKPAQVK